MSTLRRALVKLFSALVLGLGLTAILLLGLLLTKVESSVTARLLSNQPQAGSPTGIITAVGRHLERDGVPFEGRGMNYYPKDYAWKRFWVSYTEAITQINTELDLAKGLGVNAVRFFVHYDLFDGSDQTYLNYLQDFVDRLRARDMVAVVTLFDLYSSPPYSDYVTSKRHISAVVNTLGITNPAVLAWDIKNEPDRDYAECGEDKVKSWLREMISYTRSLDPNHLITIGFYGAVTGTLCYDPAITDTLVYSPAIAAEFAPLVDFVSMHYFLSERCYKSDVQALQSQIDDKPLVLEEFGLHTCSACADSHTEDQQAAYYNALLSLSEAHGLAGYLFWTLSDFSYILPGSQETHHCQGVLRNSLVNTCQLTTTLDYAEKPAACTVRRHYQDPVAYLDLFDGWVVTDTDEPPPGWSDNWSEGGALLRGYNPPQLLWSHDQGKVAFSKFVTNGTSITGLAISPVLTNVNVDHHPFLSGRVFSYSMRSDYGSDCTLHVGVKDGAQITRLLTITPGTSLPHTFKLDLRQPPTNWSGKRTFQIVFELVPEGTGDGYSAAYEFDWIAIQGAVDWPYKGMTYASWTRDDYPWATSWRAQTYTDSQAISQVAITTTNPYEGQGSLALTVDLIGGDANKSNGETYVDLRYHPPLMEPPCCLTTPLNLQGVQVSARVTCTTGSKGDLSKPNGLQLFAKSVDAEDHWWSFYGSWNNIQEDQWNEVTMTPSTVAPPGGYKDPLFDPTQVVALGMKIGAGTGSTATFSGTCWVDDVRWSAGCAEAKYGFENIQNALDQLSQTHANYVSLIVTWYMDTATSTVIYSDTERTHTDEEIVATIQDIHQRDMAVMLKPHVDVLDEDETWRGKLTPSDRDLWFASYEAFISHYAEIAEDNSVELFSIGTELVGLSGDSYRTYWDAVIDAVEAHYSGPLTYAANWGWAPDAEYMNVSFWDRLDLAGIDAYFPLSDEADPSLEQLIAGWSSYNGQCWTCDIEAWQASLCKPVVFTEIGYASRDHAAQEPWLADTGSPNCALQARAYRAAVEAFKDKLWFRGMFWWAWTPFSDAGGCCDRGFTPQNKPAATYLRCVYGNCVYLPLVLRGPLIFCSEGRTEQTPSMALLCRLAGGE